MQLMSIKIGLLSVLLIKTCVRKKGGLGGFAPQTLTRSYYFEPPLSKKRSRATGLTYSNITHFEKIDFNLFGGDISTCISSIKFAEIYMSVLYQSCSSTKN